MTRISPSLRTRSTKMEQAIAQNFWVQFGALGVLALLGWYVAWMLWREYTKKAEEFIKLLEKVTAQTHEVNALIDAVSDRLPDDLDNKLDKIAEGLNVQELMTQFIEQQQPKRGTRK